MMWTRIFLIRFPRCRNTRLPRAVLSVLGALGIVGPVLFTVGFLVQGFLRTDLHNGYNSMAQQISDLTAGPDGWVQQVNYVVFGLLLMTFAVGLHLSIQKAWPWVIGSALLAWNGVELVIAGIFPLREDAAGHIFDPLGVHSVNGTIFFLCIGIVLAILVVWFPCLIVLAHRLWHLERRERAGGGRGGEYA